MKEGSNNENPNEMTEKLVEQSNDKKVEVEKPTTVYKKQVLRLNFFPRFFLVSKRSIQHQDVY